MKKNFLAIITVMMFFVFSANAQTDTKTKVNADRFVGKIIKNPPQSFFTNIQKSEVQIGEGTLLKEYPINPFYEYSYTQSIYLASEIGDIGESNLTKISYYFGGQNLSYSNNWTIYIGHTTKSQFENNDDWIPINEMTEVYNAVFSNPNASGWIEFEIPAGIFTYNGTDNIAIAIDENSSGYDGFDEKFYSSTVTNTRSLNGCSDETNPDPASPLTASTNEAVIPNIKMSFESTAAYTVIFNVGYGTDPVANAHVLINNEELITDTNGQIQIKLSPGKYDYSVITTGFENYTSTVTVVDQDITIPIALNEGTALWPVSFFVTNDNTVEPLILIGATVELGTYTPKVTDEEGFAYFMVPDGENYTCTISMLNYDTVTYNITVAGDVHKEEVKLSLTTYSVTFTAKNWKNELVENAKITIDYETITTDVNGEAVFTLAIDSHNFSVSAESLVYTGITTFDVVDQDINIPLTLYENVIAPNVYATDNESAGATIEWDANSVPVELRHDDGTATGQLGSDQGTDKTVLGSVFKHNMKITNVKWFLTEQGPSTVNLFVFGLKANGTPDGTNILFQKMGITTVVSNWNTYELPETVTAEEGFFVALSCDGHLSLGVDDGVDDPYVAQAGNCFYGFDYTKYDFLDLIDTDYPSNYLIRPIGFDYGSISKSTYAKSNHSRKNTTANDALNYIALKNPIVTNNTEVKNGAKTAQSFDLYFFPETELENQDNWTEVATGLGSDVDTYTDVSNWPATIDGVYYWAVISHFETGDSEAGISNGLVFNNYYSANFSVTENWGTNAPVDAASITITDNNGITVKGTTSNGVFSTNLTNGNYNYTVKVSYCVTETGNFTIAGSDQAIAVSLNETVANPYGLMVNVMDEDAATLTWHNPLSFSDDFESYNDFALEFDPWTLVDLDKSDTYGFINSTFPHATSPMAAIIFNPSQASPAIAFTPHSGNKFSATFNVAPSGDCNDWIIAPQTTISANDNVSFWATGGSVGYSEEKFQVFVSTTDTNPASFTALSEIVTCPANSETWIEYTYSLKDYVGKNVYVAIHVTSNNQLYFCLDDFSIGQVGAKTVQSYNIYLDDMTTPVATNVTETTYDFTKLAIGKHTAGIKAIYESGTSEISTINFELFVGIESKKNNINVYPNPSNGLFTVSVDGTYNLQVIDITGKIISTKEIYNADNLNIKESGIYMLRLTNGSETLNYKVIVK